MRLVNLVIVDGRPPKKEFLLKTRHLSTHTTTHQPNQPCSHAAETSSVISYDSDASMDTAGSRFDEIILLDRSRELAQTKGSNKSNAVVAHDMHHNLSTVKTQSRRPVARCTDGHTLAWTDCTALSGSAPSRRWTTGSERCVHGTHDRQAW